MTFRLRSAFLGPLTAVAAIAFAAGPVYGVSTGQVTAPAPVCVDGAADPDGSHVAWRLGSVSHLSMRVH